MIELLKSKKFWVTALGSVAVWAESYMGLPQEAFMSTAGIVIAALLGYGAADLGKEANKDR